MKAAKIAALIDSVERALARVGTVTERPEVNPYSMWRMERKTDELIVAFRRGYQAICTDAELQRQISVAVEGLDKEVDDALAGKSDFDVDLGEHLRELEEKISTALHAFTLNSHQHAAFIEALQKIDAGIGVKSNEAVFFDIRAVDQVVCELTEAN
jgi:hypothetical protein